MSATPAQLSALKWLRNRNGDGVFAGKGQVLLAGGERAGVMRGTWSALERLGFVERYNIRRLRVTEAGKSIALHTVSESESAP
jgi:hypothetical protein